MSETTTQRALDLMPQLLDILHLPEDQDFPPLYSITCEARHGDAGWRVRAQLLGAGSDDDRWNALQEWGCGQRVELDEPHPTSLQPSGAFRTASVTVVVGGVQVNVWAHVDANFIPPGWCCVESYRAKDACEDCAAIARPMESVHLGGIVLDYVSDGAL